MLQHRSKKLGSILTHTTDEDGMFEVVDCILSGTASSQLPFFIQSVKLPHASPNDFLLS